VEEPEPKRRKPHGESFKDKSRPTELKSDKRNRRVWQDAILSGVDAETIKTVPSCSQACQVQA